MKNIDFNNYQGITEKVTKELANGLANRFDEIFVEGLLLKGFSFNSKEELHDFAKENCFREVSDNVSVFKVKGKPFLQFNYNTDFTINYETNKTTASSGYYKFL